MHITSIKKKIELINSSQQYKYYKLLRDLEYSTAGLKAVDEKTEDVQARLDRSVVRMRELEGLVGEAKERRRQKN